MHLLFSDSRRSSVIGKIKGIKHISISTIQILLWFCWISLRVHAHDVKCNYFSSLLICSRKLLLNIHVRWWLQSQMVMPKSNGLVSCWMPNTDGHIKVWWYWKCDMCDTTLCSHQYSYFHLQLLSCKQIKIWRKVVIASTFNQTFPYDKQIMTFYKFCFDHWDSASPQ